LLAAMKGKRRPDGGIGGSPLSVVLDVIDVSNPARPTRISSLTQATVAYTGAAVGLNHAYIAGLSIIDGECHGSTIGIVNLTNPSVPRWERSLDFAPDTFVRWLHWSGGFLYAVIGGLDNAGQLLVFHARNPSDRSKWLV